MRIDRIKLKESRLYSILKNNIVAAVFIVIMAVVYVVMMFGNKPWYDELYTYYYFISRGPVYAAIHWPVPNNHVGYSVLSAMLNIFGNPYIGLRGLSCMAAVANLVLLYDFSRRFMNKYLASATMMMYAGAYLIHRLSVQGRGYTLAITCYLISLHAIYRIGMSGRRICDYVIFAAALTMGLYILPSSVYWVVPVCITGGLYMLIKKYYNRLFRLVISALCAAAATLCLYSVIWLAIGANLMSKDETGAYYGMHQVRGILSSPAGALKTGIGYMLATPYIQSIDRLKCITTLPEYLNDLFGNYYSYCGVMLMMLVILITAWHIVNAIRQVYYKRSSLMASLYTSAALVSVPVMLVIQSVQPYKRVLSFYVIPIAFGLMYLLGTFCEKYTYERPGRIMSCIVMGITAVCICLRLTNAAYREPLAGRENNIEKVLEDIDTSRIDRIFYTDDYQKYVLKFYHDVMPEECEDIRDADYVITGPEFFDKKYNEAEWPVLYSYHNAKVNFVEERMVKIAEEDGYAIYTGQ